MRLGEVMAAAIRIFGERLWPFLVLGSVVAGAFLLFSVVPIAAFIALISIVFVVALAMTAALVDGASLEQAARRCLPLAPDLVLLALVVAVPFYVSSLFVVLLIAGAAWLALTGLAVPVAVLEKPAEERVLGRALHGLRRGFVLSRAAYLHAFGVIAALVLVQLLFSVLLSVALSAYADNPLFVAQALTQIVLAPFFFLGLTVLYFDQQARSGEDRTATG
jgi:hypothetical protein